MPDEFDHAKVHKISRDKALLYLLNEHAFLLSKEILLT